MNLWTVARLASLSMGFSRQEHSSGLPYHPPGNLFDPGIELESLMSPALQADSLPKRLPAMWETWVRSLGRGDPLETEMATYSSILAVRILWREEPGRQ